MDAVPGFRGRSIPACAGEPPPAGRPARGCAVYPRVCGGTRSSDLLMRLTPGLSPRVRGNPYAYNELAGRQRSIPACAGEPTASPCPACRTRVYPRVCGGTRWRPHPAASRKGLSPRVRGNPGSAGRPVAASGSIPACAGEPRLPCLYRRTHWVYPRVCGGTPMPIVARSCVGGLSPRVRGNPGGRRGRGDGAGSIPACAGEPLQRPRIFAPPEVYPRVCGGTFNVVRRTGGPPGLSPRVRGNRRVQRPARIVKGSIPACAGEPRCPLGLRSGMRVYPRVCGGTGMPMMEQTAAQGLSPRVRGNHAVMMLNDARSGSIPACAGEPISAGSSVKPARVYPRVCGGTVDAPICRPASSGLSPRVRGNPTAGPPGDALVRSIPACAGEPRLP